MHTTPLEEKRTKYGRDAKVTMTIAKSELKCLIVEAVDRIYQNALK